MHLLSGLCLDFSEYESTWLYPKQPSKVDGFCHVVSSVKSVVIRSGHNNYKMISSLHNSRVFERRDFLEEQNLIEDFSLYGDDLVCLTFDRTLVFMVLYIGSYQFLKCTLRLSSNPIPNFGAPSTTCDMNANPHLPHDKGRP